MTWRPGRRYHVELGLVPLTRIHSRFVNVTFGNFWLLPEDLDKEQKLRTGPGLQLRLHLKPVHLQHLLRLFAFQTEVHVGPPTPLVVPNAVGHLSVKPVSYWCHVTESAASSEPTLVAFTLSKGLLRQPDHWMISCWQRDR